MENHLSPLFDHVGRIVNRLVFLEKKAVFEVEGVRLHPSETHVLHAVLRDPDLSVTGLAEALGITPGAVSQTLTRLVAKGMIRRRPDRASNNELRIEFTPAGHAAITRFLDERAELWRNHKAYLQGLSEAERRTIHTFLTSLEGVIDDLA